MITRRPRVCASRPYRTISSGIRWAETTSASYAMSNSLSACAAALIVGQSESDPITIPTDGPENASSAARADWSVIGLSLDHTVLGQLDLDQPGLVQLDLDQ